MAFDIDPCVFEFLFVAKDLYDYGLLDKALETYGNMEVCEDYYSLAWEGIFGVFEYSRQYWNEENAVETLVFMDPVITCFYWLCTLYEAKRGIPKDRDPLRRQGEDEVYGCFRMDAYDFGAALYDGARGHPRLVVLSGEEFYGHAELPGVLAEIRDTLRDYCEKLKAAIAAEKSLAALPEYVEKEAA